jgi:hypothetical protein
MGFKMIGFLTRGFLAFAAFFRLAAFRLAFRFAMASPPPI